MTFWALMLLACSPAPARDADPSGAASVLARQAIEALPFKTRAELRKTYLRYQDEVSRRLDQGWQPGLLNESVIADAEKPFQPARTLQDSLQNRRKELAELEEAYAKTPLGERQDAQLTARLLSKRAEVKDVERRAGRAKGICRDWSDALWARLTRMKLAHWTVEDRRRTARPFHTAAVVCAKDVEPPVCLAFDPWARGEPEVYDFSAWNDDAPGGRIPLEYLLHVLPEKRR